MVPWWAAAMALTMDRPRPCCWGRASRAVRGGMDRTAPDLGRCDRRASVGDGQHGVAVAGGCDDLGPAALMVVADGVFDEAVGEPVEEGHTYHDRTGGYSP
jgi:hypothetical protein